MNKHFNYDTQNKESTPIAESNKTKVKCSLLNLRKKPSMESKVIAKLPKGTDLIVEGIENGWSKVKTEDGKFGYVVSEYI